QRATCEVDRGAEKERARGVRGCQRAVGEEVRVECDQRCREERAAGPEKLPRPGEHDQDEAGGQEQCDEPRSQEQRLRLVVAIEEAVAEDPLGVVPVPGRGVERPLGVRADGRRKRKDREREECLHQRRVLRIETEVAPGHVGEAGGDVGRLVVCRRVLAEGRPGEHYEEERHGKAGSAEPPIGNREALGDAIRTGGRRLYASRTRVRGEAPGGTGRPSCSSAPSAGARGVAPGIETAASAAVGPCPAPRIPRPCRFASSSAAHRAKGSPYRYRRPYRFATIRASARTSGERLDLRGQPRKVAGSHVAKSTTTAG